MSLLIIDVLNGMFKVAQEDVGLRQLFDLFRFECSALFQQRQRFQSAFYPKLRLSTAPDHLKGLRNEFDFANAAAAQLNVDAQILTRFPALRFSTNQFM